ncbi:hypothetical protein CPB84DRAFT_260124 [Gymnopilus junonius]|uniref:Uncharacterized protein n=1 Tax=Gymnopilus junonius TaxID=109634 RepID=A0A9P5NBW7_GYMJU|nr:hypothetical protein CPB84DRAFT_260124 [Gymnopilus junonius]
MSFYTGSSYQLNLPRTPDAFTNVVSMNSVNGRASDLLHGFKGWRSSSSTTQKGVEAPLTPPMSTSFQARTTTGNPYPTFHQQHPSSSASISSRPSTSSGTSMTLPPIAHLERHLSHLPPLTPPEDIPSAQSSRLAPLPQILPVPLPRISAVSDDYYSTSSSKPMIVIPASQSQHSEVQQPPPLAVVVPPPQSESQVQAQPAVQQGTQDSTTSYVVDWLDFTRTRSAHFIAEKTCEMICYLWFAAPPPLSKSSSATSSPTGSPSTSPSMTCSLPTPPSSSPSSTAPPSTLQLVATPPFVQFMQKLLETTQVSQSMDACSTWERVQDCRSRAYDGNKFLDDNTYTNKTWSEVSGIELDEINRMEREFLLGVDFNLYVDKVTYESWLNLLKGLVLAKERDCRKWAGGRGSREKRKRVTAPTTPSVHSHPNGHTSHHVHAPQAAARTFSMNASVPPAAQAPAVVASATVARPTAKAYAYKTHHGHRARSTSPTVRTSSVPAPTTRHAAVYVSYAPSGSSTVPVSTYVPASTYTAPAVSTSNAYVYASSSTSTSTGTTTTSTYQAPAAPQPSYPSYTYLSTSYPSGTNSAFSSPTHRSSAPTGAKRTAEAAFSPTSATFTHLPSKRPVSMHGGMGISLRIPETQIGPSSGSSASGGASASPLDGLQSFERMSLSGGASGSAAPSPSPVRNLNPPKEQKGSTSSYSNSRSSVVPQTLSTAYDYSVNDDRRVSLSTCTSMRWRVRLSSRIMNLLITMGPTSRGGLSRTLTRRCRLPRWLLSAAPAARSNRKRTGTRMDTDSRGRPAEVSPARAASFQYVVCTRGSECGCGDE